MSTLRRMRRMASQSTEYTIYTVAQYTYVPVRRMSDADTYTISHIPMFVLVRYNNAVLKIESLKFHKVAAHSAPATSLRAAGGGNLEPMSTIFCRSRKEHLLILLVRQHKPGKARTAGNLASGSMSVISRYCRTDAPTSIVFTVQKLAQPKLK